jgi:uncharacterized protein YndB with AHSA1/START domain
MKAVNIVDDAIVQEVTIAGSAERIFDALTKPEVLLKWWHAEGKFRVTHVESDLRVGGRWLMRVEGSCGPASSCTIVTGTYLLIRRPIQLIFTWNREEEESPETTVQWDLEENSGTTIVRVTHSGLTSDALRNRNGGWPMIQQLLKGYIERPPSSEE